MFGGEHIEGKDDNDSQMHQWNSTLMTLKSISFCVGGTVQEYYAITKQAYLMNAATERTSEMRNVLWLRKHSTPHDFWF